MLSWHRASLLLLLLVTSTMLEAKILRIGYPGIPVDGIDFNNVTQLQNAAADGDTIQVYGTTGTTLVVSRRLVIQGFGYNFDIHTGLQAVGGYNEDKPSEIPLRFNPGSEQSVAEGLQLLGLTVLANNITIRRCRLTSAGLSVGGTSVVQDVVFQSCAFTNTINVGTTTFSSTGIRFYNCLMAGITVANTASSVFLTNCAHTETGGTYDFGGASALIKNSILPYSANATANTNAIYENNIFLTAQPSLLPTGSNNVWGQTSALVYNRLGGTVNTPAIPTNPAFDEAWYELKPGTSPALNAGINADGLPTDCGIFGGEPVYRYRKGGVPPIPAIYQLSAPSTNTSGGVYNITISVKSNN